MATYLIALNKDNYDTDTATVAIKDAGVKVLKQYKCGMMFLVSGAEKNVKTIDGLVTYEKYAKTANTKLQVFDTVHLDYTVDLTGNTKFDPEYTGAGEFVYLVDTGINKNHTEFSEATIVDLYSNFGTDFDDTAGHGTAIGSLIVGRNIGGAKDATLVNVKLFSDNVGQLTVGEIVEAFDAVLEHHVANNVNKVKVVSCPWVADQNNFIDAMVTEMDNSNLVVVCAAGNNGEDVNTKSPAGVDKVITVGAFDKNLQVTSFTNNVFSGSDTGFVNYGAQLDIFALGVDVVMADVANDTGYVRTNGTSISTGIVSGIVTHYITQYPFKNSDQIKDIVIAEGSVWGQQYLVFDGVDPTVDYSGVNKSVITTENKHSDKLTVVPSGRILNIQKGTVNAVDLGLNNKATGVAVLDFAPTPPWILFDATTGMVDVDAYNLGDASVPGVYLFAIRGTINGVTLVEEFSVGVYETSEDELDATESYYYDADLDEYDELVNYQVAPNKL